MLNRVFLTAFCICMISPLQVKAEGWGERRGNFVKKIMEEREANRAREGGSDEGLNLKGAGNSQRISLGNRDYILYTPPTLPASGRRPLVIAMHGGFGNAKNLQHYLGLDHYADQYGFMVAYLNGTAISPRVPDKMRGWNAGFCCGAPSKNNVDDLGFIRQVIDESVRTVGVDRAQVYATGHSNGAMMDIRAACETTMFRAVAVYSGALQLDTQHCPGARSTPVVNIHGSADRNLPPEGGYPAEGFNKRMKYKPQSYVQSVFEKSGGSYTLILLQGAGHTPESLNQKLQEQYQLSLPEMIVRELGFK